MGGFDGIGVHRGNLWRLSDAQTRSISPENFTGEKGRGGMATEGTGAQRARDLGQGWKVSPSVCVAPGETISLADIEGPGVIQHIWMTINGSWRAAILRVTWDDQPHPSIEVPVADFFCCGWERFAQVSSLMVCTNPANGFNSYWEMPFRTRAQMSLTNLSDEEMIVYYQISFARTPVPDDAAYLHAQFRRNNPLPYKQVHTLLDGVRGQGHYVGTYLAWGVNNSGWWGEGEIKFYMDGDTDWPTICGTGTEDYIGGAYNFDLGEEAGGYTAFTTPYSGMHQVIRPDGRYRSQTRFGMYRWHITDPIRFAEDLRVTIQALGWRSGERYLPLQDDIASVAWWYQTLPSQPLFPLPDKDGLEVI